MNKVITINLGGNAYQLEESGYDLLRAYLETAGVRLQNNPDRDEILSDIEAAIGEKFRALLASHKTVVVTQEVSVVLTEMGPVEAGPETGDPAAPAGAAASGTGGAGGTSATGGSKAATPEAGALPRRLYRITEGEMLAGVCNGIAAYFHLDPTIVRLAFVFLTIFWGTGVLIYVILAIVVPTARTPEEKSAAAGSPATAQEFIRRAKAGYYEAAKTFQESRAHRRWGRWFRREMRANAGSWRYGWFGPWAPPATGGHPELAFVLPILSLLRGATLVLCVCAMISLLATGSVLGLPLPGNVPPWVAALLLFIAYGILTGSLKAARRLIYWSSNGAAPSPAVLFLEAVVWLAVTAVLLALAIHFFPEVRTGVQALPAIVHQAVIDIQNWWASK